MLIKLPKIVIGNLEYQMGKSVDLEILNYNQIYAENKITRLGHHLDYINTLHGTALMTHPKQLCSQYLLLFILLPIWKAGVSVSLFPAKFILKIQNLLNIYYKQFRKCDEINNFSD